MKKFLFYLFLISKVKNFAQTSQIIHQSGYKHEYVIGRIAYLENLKDTTRHKYIATLKIHTKYHPINVAGASGLIETKIKELGANGFYLQSFSEKDSSITLTIRSFFINDSYFKINNTYKIKNNVFLFSDFCKENYFQSCYINDSLLVFNTKNYFSLNPISGKKYIFKTCNTMGAVIFGGHGTMGTSTFNLNLTGIHKYTSKEDKEADFIGLYKDKLIPEDKIPDKDKIQFFNCGFNNFYYNGGRMLLEIFKPFAKN